MLTATEWKHLAIYLSLSEAVIIFARREFIWLCSQGYRDVFPSFFVSWKAQVIIPSMCLALVLYRHRIGKRTARAVLIASSIVALFSGLDILFAMHDIARALSPSMYDLRHSR